jgi:glucose uptake protein GlcU
MNTKLLMTASSLVLGLAGIFALFAPEVLLAMLGVPMANPLSVLIQLVGASYFSLALMNWTAKDSAIGGIYARPISLGNFAHFFIGTLLLAKYLLSKGFNMSIFLMLVVYAIFASLFYWLVFRAIGIVVDKN